jgi:hypothetical protein
MIFVSELREKSKSERETKDLIEWIKDERVRRCGNLNVLTNLNKSSQILITINSFKIFHIK